MGEEGGEVINAGELQYKITMQMPEQEKSKLKMMEKQAPSMGKAFGAFKAGGTAMFAAFGAVALLFGSSQGFKAILGLFWDVLGLLADLIFIAVLPFLIPLIQGIGRFIQWAVGAFQAGGMLGLLKEGAHKMGEGIKALWEKFPDIIAKLNEWRTAVVNFLFDWERWKTAGTKVAEFLLNGDNWKMMGGVVWEVIKTSWKLALQVGGAIWYLFVGLASGLWAGLKGLDWASIGKSIGNAIVSLLEWAINKLIDVINKIPGVDLSHVNFAGGGSSSGGGVKYGSMSYGG